MYTYYMTYTKVIIRHERAGNAAGTAVSVVVTTTVARTTPSLHNTKCTHTAGLCMKKTANHKGSPPTSWLPKENYAHNVQTDLKVFVHYIYSTAEER